MVDNGPVDLTKMGAMKLHEQIVIENGNDARTIVIRVPDGWIYRTTCSDQYGIPQLITAVFVPKEFS